MTSVVKVKSGVVDWNSELDADSENPVALISSEEDVVDPSSVEVDMCSVEP